MLKAYFSSGLPVFGLRRYQFEVLEMEMVPLSHLCLLICILLLIRNKLLGLSTLKVICRELRFQKLTNVNASLSEVRLFFSPQIMESPKAAS